MRRMVFDNYQLCPVTLILPCYIAVAAPMSNLATLRGLITCKSTALSLSVKLTCIKLCSIIIYSLTWVFRVGSISDYCKFTKRDLVDG